MWRVAAELVAHLAPGFGVGRREGRGARDILLDILGNAEPCPVGKGRCETIDGAGESEPMPC